jgi:hypothetical protein
LSIVLTEEAVFAGKRGELHRGYFVCLPPGLLHSIDRSCARGFGDRLTVQFGMMLSTRELPRLFDLLGAASWTVFCTACKCASRAAQLCLHSGWRRKRASFMENWRQQMGPERWDSVTPERGSVRYVELLKTQRQKVPALKAAIEDLKAGRLQAGWEKLEHHGVIKEVTDGVELRQRAVEQHLEAEGVIGAEDHAVTVLCRMDLGPEAGRDVLHYAPGRVVGFHTRTAGGFKPGEKWTVRETNCDTVTLECNGKVRQFKPSAKWDVLVSSTMQVSIGQRNWPGARGHRCRVRLK